MLPEERRHNLLRLTAERGRVKISEAAKRFGVSEMTIHRDIQLLESQGLVRKLHGGVALAGVQEVPYRERIVQQYAQKRAIAEAAVRLVQPGYTLYLSPGTTTTEIARLLPNENLTVVTNSLPIAQELMHATQLEVVLTGGSVRRYAEALVGPAAEASLDQVFVNLAFVGITGMDPVGGLTVYSESEARVLQAALRSARKTILVADSSKWGKVMGPQVAPVEMVHVLISDAALPKSAVEYLQARDVAVTLVEVVEDKR